MSLIRFFGCYSCGRSFSTIDQEPQYGLFGWLINASPSSDCPDCGRSCPLTEVIDDSKKYESEQSPTHEGGSSTYDEDGGKEAREKGDDWQFRDAADEAFDRYRE